MQSGFKSVYEFGAFRLDVADRQLKRAGKAVPLAPKVFELLVFLLENNGRAISKDELLSKVWPDSFVTDENLSRHISTLRKTLNEGDAGQPFIETLPKFGYRFTDQVRVVAPTAEPEWEPEAQSPVQPDSLTAPLPAPLPPGADAREVAVAAGWVTQAKPRSSAQPISRFRILAPLNADGKGEVMVAEDARMEPALLKRRTLVFSLGVVVITGFVLGLYNWVKPRLARSAKTPSVVPFTSFLGRENLPAFSPDDKMLAFTWDGQDGKNTDIYVKLLDAETPLRLTTDPARDISPAWSPDGRYIAFVRLFDEGAGIYLVPTLGGPERELITGIWSAGNAAPAGRLAWSPDGKFLVFAGRMDNQPQNGLRLFLYDFASQEKRQLTDSPQDDRSPVISPDGQTLAFIRGLDEIYVMPATGGQVRQLTFESKRIFGLAWSTDGRELIFSSARAGNPTLWKLAATGGQPEALSPGGDQVGNLALAHQGNRLVYAQNINNQSIWQLELPAAHASTPNPQVSLISSTRQDMTPEFSPDGKHIVFVSTRSGWRELWLSDSAGQNLQQLTRINGPFVINPSFSPDGKQIAFGCTLENDQQDIYVINRGGGPPRRLTFEAGAEMQPSWSRDGQWIYFSSARGGSEQIWKMPSAGGAAVQVTQTSGRQAFEAPDGKYLYFSKKPDEPGIWRIPSAGGPETLILPLGRHDSWARWEQGIYLVKPTTSPRATLEFFSFATEQTSAIATLEKSVFNDLMASPDGRKLLWSQVDRNESDLILVENFH